jgi:UDP-N-acetylmuramate: L-alanyl-gamma-D-glutamyl-meso-diaminopimelate ligase
MIPEVIRHIHFVAICGTGMGSLAGMLKSLGYRVTGSDEHIYPPMSTFLESIGIPVLEGFAASHLDPAPDLVVIGNAVSRGNPEAEEVLNRKLRYMSLPEVLKEFFIRGKYSCVVAGTHGKTTTSSMLAWVLESAGRDPGFFVGGLPENFGRGYQLGSGPHFVLEGDEYDSAFFDKGPKFLHYLPDLVILNNVEFDHADIYRNFEEVRTAFRRLINIIPGNGHLVACADDAVVLELSNHAFSHVHTFGLSSQAEWRACDVEFGPAGTRFRIEYEGRVVAEIATALSGFHNVRNALGCFVAAHQLGLSPEEIAGALQTFRGVRKRLQFRGEFDGVLVFDDFAHHPTEVRETLAAVRQRFPDRRIWAVFEPRTATSKRKIFEEEYARAFSDADRVVIAPLYRPDKVPESERLSLERVIDRLRRAGFEAETCAIGEPMLSLLEESVEEGDVLLFMSNGDFGGVPDRLVERLAVRSAT